MRFIHHLLALSFVAFLLVALRGAEPPAKSKTDPEALLKEGDRLADKKDYAGALLQYKQAYEHLVPQMRGLKFLQPVNPKLMTRDQLQKHIDKLIKEETSPEENYFEERLYQALGMAPASFDLNKTAVEMHTQEVAGFYDPKRKDLVLIQEAKKPKKQRSALSFFFGEEPEFDKDEQKITLSHEMTHALQDQHFDLEAMDKAVEHDDDMTLAYTALVEGDATMLMIQEMFRQEGNAEQALKLSPAATNFSFTLMRFLLPFSAGKAFREAPFIVRDSLVFPYHRGLVFVAHLTNRGGWNEVDQAFRDPPVSTEQILHPEKYLSKDRDVPLVVELPDLTSVIDGAWKRSGENVLGEYQIGVMLTGRPRALQAASGWDGDSVVLFEDEKKQPALLWASIWDTEHDAEEFFQAYASYVREKHPNGGASAKTSSEKNKKQERDQSQVRWTSGRSVFHIERREREVVASQGFSAEKTDNLIELAFQAKTSPKKFQKPSAKRESE